MGDYNPLLAPGLRKSQRSISLREQRSLRYAPPDPLAPAPSHEPPARSASTVSASGGALKEIGWGKCKAPPAPLCRGLSVETSTYLDLSTLAVNADVKGSRAARQKERPIRAIADLSP